MILTKRQIIDIALKESVENVNSKAYNRMLMRIFSYPEIDFIQMIHKELNWSLEPIRKNTYIVK